MEWSKIKLNKIKRNEIELHNIKLNNMKRNETKWNETRWQNEMKSNETKQVETKWKETKPNEQPFTFYTGYVRALEILEKPWKIFEALEIPGNSWKSPGIFLLSPGKISQKFLEKINLQNGVFCWIHYK